MYSLSRKTNYLASEEANSCISKSSLSFLSSIMIFNGENTLFTKSAQKWSSFRKNYFIFFHIFKLWYLWNFFCFFEPELSLLNIDFWNFINAMVKIISNNKMISDTGNTATNLTSLHLIQSKKKNVMITTRRTVTSNMELMLSIRLSKSAS